MAIVTLITLDDLNNLRTSWRNKGETVAFVPTMGALHDGHMSLVRLAKQSAQKVIVSIFVNPTQFGPNEDFERYPRTVVADLDLLEKESVDAVFLPNVSTLYPLGFQTTVRNKELENELCGAFRPGHFEGVLSVVLKLFNMVQPDLAIFGKKDYQQWRLIETMARDLNLAVEVVGAETIRESDGLAMSSRNRYLEPNVRAGAAAIYSGLKAAALRYESGERDSAKLTAICRAAIEAIPDTNIEYIELRRQIDLLPYKPELVKSTEVAPKIVMIVAVRFGKVRLIDNLEFV